MTAKPSGPAWVADLLASLVVFMVALPLCIGIAQACGLPPEAGIITGVVGGLVVGPLAGSPLQVSGPAAGLIVLVVDFLDDAHHAGRTGPAAVALLGVALAIAGLLQIAAGAARLGRLFRAVSPAVVGGMLAGIGVTIVAKQFHEMVDDDAPRKVVDGLLTLPAAVWKGIAPPPGAKADHRAAAVVGVLTILVLVAWKRVAPRLRLKVVPGAVAAVAVAVAVTEGFGLGIDRVQFTRPLLDAIRPIDWPGWGVFGSAVVWQGAVTFALIASAETLLCAAAVDGMHGGPRTRYDRELSAQGVGNLVCGCLGTLPMTGVIVRSSANVEAGARTRLSTILHGAWLLLFVSLLPGALGHIPASALAAVLVYTGWKLLDLPGLMKLWREGRAEALTFVATAAGVVFVDLLSGVVLGVLLSAARLLWAFSYLRVDRVDEPNGDRIHLSLDGMATFLRLPVLSEALDGLPRGRRVHVHLDRVKFVDHAVLRLLLAFQAQYEANGGTVFVDQTRLYDRFKAGTPASGFRAARPAPGDSSPAESEAETRTVPLVRPRPAVDGRAEVETGPRP